MLQIESSFVRQARQANSHKELATLMQKAVELEHATLPPYLTAMFSLKAGTNEEIREIISSIVLEEMLHMCIAANVLTALGGHPAIDAASFVPTYPGPLPMGIAGHLDVALAPYSHDVVTDVFMAIEEPEHPIEFPTGDAALPDFATIGQFYGSVIERIEELGDPLPGPPAKQVSYPDFFDPAELFPITEVAEAVAGLTLIVREGEGTSTSPLDAEGELAHYYRFQELSVGRHLVADPSSPEGFSFTGPAIPFDSTGVWPIAASTHAADLPEETEARQLADRFNDAYSRLLRGLHRTFRGEPGFIAETLSVMFDVELLAARLVSTPWPARDGVTVGPPFEWTPAPVMSGTR